MRIGDRIKQARTAFRPEMSQAALGKIIGTDQSTVGHWERGRGGPRGEMLEKVATALRVSPQWLQFGIGDGPDGGDLDPADDLVDRDGATSSVRILEVEAGALSGPSGGFDVLVWGDGRESAAVTGVYSLPEVSFRDMFPSPAENLRIVPVRGDSMMPTLMPGQRVFVDIADLKPSPEGLFVLWDGLGMVIKRVRFIFQSDPASVLILSDNKNYPPYERLLGEAYIQGRIVGFVQRS